MEAPTAVAALLEGAPEGHEPGPEERRVVEILSGDWDGISLDHYGPDGSIAISRLVFKACPLCFAVVPPDSYDADRDTERFFALDHGRWHVAEARKQDSR